MHFDEVYHARTATEFLQVWRYGESHDIYEWTHPHLAKYAMAAGIVLLGGDEVSATSDLGVPVRAAAIEHRREDPLTGERAGERVHIATGDEIRTEDLRTRAAQRGRRGARLVGAVRGRGLQRAHRRLRRRPDRHARPVASSASRGSSRSRSGPSIIPSSTCC